MLSLLVAFAAAVGGNAQTTYYNVGSTAVASFEPETNYVLVNAYAVSSPGYLAGTSTASSASSSCIYQFEEVGADADGNTTYRLKQVSTGTYLEDPELSSGTITMTSSASRAYVFTAKQSVSHDSYDSDYMATVDLSTYVYGVDMENAFVFCNVNYTSSDYYWFCSTGAGVPTWTQYVNTTAWVAYEVTEASGYETLYMLVNELFASGTPSELYTAGTSAGQVDSELLATLVSVYESAMAMLEDPTLEDDSYYTIAEQLEEAYNAVVASVIPFQEGYYIITNAGTDRGNGNAVLYDAGTTLGWYEFAYDATAEFSADNADCIWQVISADGGGYYLKNFSTGRYMGSQSSLYTAVPSSATASQVYQIDVQSGSIFNIYTTNQNTSYPALHAQGDGTNIVIWTMVATASGWYFTEVPESLIQELSGSLDVNQLKSDTEELVDEAKAALVKGISLSSDATKDGYFETAGLVTDASCFFTNAQEPTEGSLAYLIDNDQTTYFHSTWSTDASSDRTHYVGADLGKEVQYVDVKYSRRNTGSSGTPMTIRVYACNDTTDASNWVEQSVYTFSYIYPSTTYSEEADEFTGLTSVALDAPYRFIRLDVEHTLNDATTNSNLYFVFSELRFYEGTYDAENSLIEAVPDEVIAELETQIEVAKTALEDGTLTQDVFDALQAAYDAFEAAYPDIDAVNDLYEECQAQLEAAVEGEELGYFASGSKATFEAALAEIAPNISAVMTVAEVNACIEALQAAYNTFMAALVVPADGTYLRIRSASTSTADGTPYRNCVYAQDNDESAVLWGGYDADAGVDEYLETRLNYLWKVVAHGDGTFSLLNMGTGTYLGSPSENGEDVTMSFDADTISFRSAKSAGLFNIVFADGVYCNAEPATYSVVSWGTASGTDNSAFELIVVTDWDATYHYDLTAEAQVVTLPLSIYGFPGEGSLYKVLGLNSEESTIQLSQYDDDEEIPAGTPFVYIPNEGSTATYTDFFTAAETLDDIEHDLTAKSLNGLNGVLVSQTVGAGQGIIFKGAVTLTTATDVVAANSGYFTDAMPATTETGAAQLTVDGVITAIKAVNLSSASNTNVYTISGVLVRKDVKAASATSGLPKGLYIVGGKKVYVK